MKKHKRQYSAKFYTNQVSGSYLSAKVYALHLSNFLSPSSVADIGCGIGAWLKAFKEAGAKTLIGFDGDWNTQQDMIDGSIIFKAVDLNRPISNTEKVDLAMSLEVGEHLEPSSARTLVNSLTDMADVVLFGAAFTDQGGTNHINEQPHTYWAKLFSDVDFAPFDIFRPVFWGDERVEFWYRQNTFLYVRRDSAVFLAIVSKGASPMLNVDFMNCIHPVLYEKKIRPNFGQGLRIIFNLFMHAIR
jgi:SAM-dependent methyltransferase